MDIEGIRAKSNQTPSSAGLKRYLWAIALTWTILLGIVLAAGIEEMRRHILDLAYSEARALFNKDVTYRLWAASHGGVYVPVTETTPPNPYLANVPERDIKTPSGRSLTLMNPAYMTRQVHEMGAGLYGTRGHITSLNPIRPENAPDEWETTALRAFAQGDPFRIVLTDMQMPEMDGESLGRAVKADPELHDTLLVMMTSLGRRGDAKRLEAIGFSAYLIKPVKKSQLYDCLAAVLGVAAPPVKAPEAALVTRHTLSEDRRRKARILLAEDNPTNQQVALRILEKMGFRADAVANGREAIQALKMAPYDIVFMDVQMPVMDGFEATRQIRDPQSAVCNHKIPIIAMTAHAMKGDRERCLEAGMDDYVPKPISPQALASALEKWLDRTQEQPPSVPAPAGETEPSEEPPVFDRQALRDRLMGDEELVREIIAGFLEDMPKQMRRLREHVGQGQAGLAGGQAHAIRSAAGNVGGMALSAAAFEIEKAGNKGQLEGIAALMPELERQFDRLEAQMREGES